MTEGKKPPPTWEREQETFPEARINRTVELVASTLKAEFCRIFKLCRGYELSNSYEFSHDCIDPPKNKAFIQEIECIGQPGSLDALAGGISVFIRSQGKTSMIITLYRTRPDGFTPEEVRFLRYVLSLVLKIQECKKIDLKLQDRILFLESLLEKAPNPAYFKGLNRDVQSLSGPSPGKTANFLNKKAVGYSMHELEEVIPKELTAIYKRKKEESLGISGELTGMMPGICVFRESEEALKIALEVQKVLWTIINNSPAVVFLWRNSEKWPADFVSENVSQFGYKVEDFTSGRVLYGDIVHREDIENVAQKLARCIEDKCESFKMEYRIFTKGG